MTELYQQEQGNLATGGSSATQHTRAASEAAYQKRAESLLADENCYKVVIVSMVVFSLAWITIALVSLIRLLWNAVFVHCLNSRCSFDAKHIELLIPLEYLVNNFFQGFSLLKVGGSKFKCSFMSNVSNSTMVSLPLNSVIFWSPACTLVFYLGKASSVDSGSLRDMLLFRTEGSSWNPTWRGFCIERLLL